MNSFQFMVTVRHNARVFKYNRWWTKQEIMVKLWSEVNIQHDSRYRCRAQSNLPPRCLGWLGQSASTWTEPFRLDGNSFCWCAHKFTLSEQHHLCHGWWMVSRCRPCKCGGLKDWLQLLCNPEISWSIPSCTSKKLAVGRLKTIKIILHSMANLAPLCWPLTNHAQSAFEKVHKYSTNLI
jgi:hypothetical protein